MCNFPRSGCDLNISEYPKFDSFRKMHENQRICGLLEQIEFINDEVLAVIGGIPILLPIELDENLSDMVGHKIAILKLSGFHFRELKGA